MSLLIRYTVSLTLINLETIIGSLLSEREKKQDQLKRKEESIEIRVS